MSDQSGKRRMLNDGAKAPDFKPRPETVYFKVVKVKRSHNGKRSIITCEDPKEFYQTDPMSPEVERLLGKRSHCYVALAIDISTGIAHFGPELGGLSW